MKIYALLFAFVFSISANSQMRFQTRASVLPKLKKLVCKVESFEKGSMPEGSANFATAVKAKDEAFFENCMKVDNSDKIADLSARRSTSCMEECANPINQINNIVDCRKACGKQNIELNMRLVYFNEGLEAALDSDCGRTLPKEAKDTKGSKSKGKKGVE